MRSPLLGSDSSFFDATEPTIGFDLLADQWRDETDCELRERYAAIADQFAFDALQSSIDSVDPTDDKLAEFMLGCEGADEASRDWLLR